MSRSRSVLVSATLLAVLAGDVRSAAADPSPATGVIGDSSGEVALPLGGGMAMDNALASTDLATGAALSTIPIALPHARGAVQPRLSLQYDSSSGLGEAGVGWGLHVPSIERRPLSNAPTYNDAQDRFVYMGSPLVPMCVVPASCPAIDKNAPLPEWSDGWTLYRLEKDDLHARFFHLGAMWRIQFTSGELMELGERADTGDMNGLDTDAGTPGGTFRWHVVKDSDANGNAVVYAWTHLGLSNRGYLSDIYDTANAPGSSTYAHHVHLTWEAPPLSPSPDTPMWHAALQMRVSGIDVTSASFSGTALELLRRYHLAYEPLYPFDVYRPPYSLLQSVTVEGRCPGAIAELSTGLLPEGTGCPTLPAISMTYTTESLAPGAHVQLTASPAITWPTKATQDEGAPDAVLVDLNADGLTDVIQPPHSGGNQTIWLNNGTGTLTTTAATSVTSNPPAGGATLANMFGTATTNHCATFGDFSGCGRPSAVWSSTTTSFIYDWTHVPSVGSPGTWAWSGRAAAASLYALPSDTTGSALKSLIGDIDGDGYVDRLRVTPDISSFVSGGYAELTTRGEVLDPGGAIDGNVAPFGASTNVGKVPHGARTLPSGEVVGTFGTYLVDMNGDGLADLFQVFSAGPSQANPNIAPLYFGYIAGDGTGAFFDSTGAAKNEIFLAQEIDAPIPWDTLLYAYNVQVGDVTGDGIGDLVILNPDTGVTSVYAFNGEATLVPAGTFDLSAWPGTTAFVVGSLQLVDMDGSGVADVVVALDDSAQQGSIVYADMARSDPTMGVPPGLLTSIEYGPNTEVDITYATTTTAANRSTWTTPMPQILPIVTNITRKNFVASASTGDATQTTSDDFTYTNPEYDGWNRQFLGFQKVEARHSGTSGTTATRATRTRTTFYYANPFDDPTQSCAVETGNLHPVTELLQGRPVLEERWEEDNTYLDTRHIGYGYQSEGTGTDGRPVWFAWARQVDTVLYDTADFIPGATPVLFTDLTDVNGMGLEGRSYILAGSPYSQVETIRTLDPYGNESSLVDMGEVSGTLGAIVSKDGAITHAHGWQTPTGDATGWTFRMIADTVSGAGGGSRTRSYAYDAAGNLLQVGGTLTGTLPLARANQNGLATAPAPSGASVDSVVIVQSTYKYDGHGNVTTASGPDGRCVSTIYDPLFAQLPVSASAYSQGCNSANPLVTLTTYDRGLGAATTTTSPNGAITVVAYDGFGRPYQAMRPGADGSQGGGATTTVTYLDPVAGSPIRVHTTTTGAGVATSETWTYYDGFGKVILALATADPSMGDGGSWLASGLGQMDYEGNVVKSFQPWFYSADPSAYPITSTPTTASSTTTFDGFGRGTFGTNLEGGAEWEMVYHALSADVYDAGGLASSPPAPLGTRARDGHGRTKLVTRNARDGSDAISTATSYLATGEPTQITQSHTADAKTVTHWMQYDSFGRMVFNFEPNAGVQSASGGGTKGWTYAYDDAGDLVGTSDARGCGENLTYDGLGRLTSEDYSPCLATQALYTAAPEATYGYDSDEAGQPSGGYALGNLTYVRDRGAHDQFQYDARGLEESARRQIAAPNGGAYTDYWFTKSASYDGLGRVTSETTGADVPELLVTPGPGMPAQSIVSPVYSARGLVAQVTSSYGQLVTETAVDADGFLRGQTYGDTAGTQLLVTPDPERRLSEYQVRRNAPAIWAGVPATGYAAPPVGSKPTVVMDLKYGYDTAERIHSIQDARLPNEWLPGTQPVNRTYAYDGFDRLASVLYASGSDIQLPETSPSDPDPVPARKLATRVKSQTFLYDWLGNTTHIDDDLHAFYDRSLGTVTNSTAHPNQLASATSIAPCPPLLPHCTPEGLSTVYDLAGNMTSLLVARNEETCTSATGECAHRFVYDWDEVGQLVRARRWDYLNATQDTFPAVPTTTAAVDLTYAYSQGARVLKTARDAAGSQTNSLEVFSSLRLNDAAYDPTSNTYERDATTETAYLAGGLARVFYAETALPSAEGNKLHVFYEIGDHQGSTSAVIDGATSELVQASTYQAYGAPDSDSSSTRWGEFREDYRFTGKEDDRDVGLTYFGARYYHASLGRWISADPLTVHAAGSDPNAYAYVNGSPGMGVDPTGLSPDDWASAADDAPVQQQQPPPANVEGSSLATVSTDAPTATWTQLDVTEMGTSSGAGGSGGATGATPTGTSGTAPAGLPTQSGLGQFSPQASEVASMFGVQVTLGVQGGFDTFARSAWNANMDGAAGAAMTMVAIGGYGPSGAMEMAHLYGLLRVASAPVFNTDGSGKNVNINMAAGLGTVAGMLPGMIAAPEEEGPALLEEQAAIRLPQFSGTGFSSFADFKQAFGSVAPDFQWHHIVEQTSSNIERFGAEAIHNTNNVIPMETLAHRRVSAYYSSKFDFTDGMTVRQWLAPQSFEAQHSFGVGVLQRSLGL